MVMRTMPQVNRLTNTRSMCAGGLRVAGGHAEQRRDTRRKASKPLLARTPQPAYSRSTWCTQEARELPAKQRTRVRIPPPRLDSLFLAKPHRAPDNSPSHAKVNCPY